ncbi:MAG TPA: arylsulfotransferase family protein, partial [Solirubrobacteraceae bacterium]|nr:arylsulfotransferase family protein [Solirubrobacteraceae bacterium]
GPAQTGSFTSTVSVSAGQEFTIASTAAGQTTTYYIRCLPSDFPAFTASRTGSTQAEFYVVTPNLYLPPPGVVARYVAIFDTNGVPVWWMRSAGNTVPMDAKLLSDGDIAWMHQWPTAPGGEEHRLDGSLVRTLNTVGGGADQHDVVLLPNGDYLMGRTFTRFPVDMSACGGPVNGVLRDFELQELTPSGALVWSWRASDHIPVSEVAPQFRGACRYGGDVYHWNSVDPVDGGYVLSFRSLDAVYRIDRATGAIVWKLGGTPTSQSLAVINDPYSATSTFCGQHDARLLLDGSLTVHDNGSGCNRPARVVRYAIDPTARTATLLESLRKPFVPGSSWCCGSARKLPGGDWVVSWGASRYVTEQTPDGRLVFTLTFLQGLASYRAFPILPGQLSIAALRAGMDAQYPGG